MEYLYKVLIVEKQSQMVHIYKNMLPWEDYQFQVTTVTDNEDKALAYFGEYKPELILTGIDLNSGNGISLIRQLKQLQNDCHVVVISSHDDYDTVREAFKVGVDDYLLKSRLRYSLLASVLEEIKRKLEKKSAPRDDDWSEKLEKLLGLIRDNQKIDKNMILQLIQRDELRFMKNNYRMIYFRLDNVRIFNRTMKQYDKPSWMSSDEFINMFRNKLVLRDEMQFKLKEIIGDIFEDVPAFQLSFTKKHSGLIILPPLEKEVLIHKMQLLIDECYRILNYDFSATLSKTGKGYETFIDIYEETIKYHHHKYYDGDRCMEFVDEGKIYHELDITSVDFKERILHNLSIQDFDEVLSLSKQAILYMKENYVYVNDVQEYFISIIVQIEAMLESKGICIDYPFQVLRQGIIEAESIFYLDLELEKIFKTFNDWLRDNKLSKYQKKVAVMIQYIESNLHKKITLPMVANSVGLSEIHASRIFKKETGQGVIEFVSEKKMHLAAELLKDEKQKIKDISLAVGMEDQLYFNKVFKKVYHLSPREFRKKN